MEKELLPLLNDVKEKLHDIDFFIFIGYSEDDLTDLHSTFGRYLRNTLPLWQKSKFTEYFNSVGIEHPDDMSGILILSLHRLLNNKPIQLEEQISEYKNYWNNHKNIIGVNVNSDKTMTLIYKEPEV